MRIAIIMPVFRQKQHLQRFFGSVVWQLGPSDVLRIACEEEEFEDIMMCLPNELNARAFECLVIRKSGEKNAASARVSAIRSLPPDIDWIKFLDADDVLAPFALETFRNTHVPSHVHCIAGASVQVVNGVPRKNYIANWSSIAVRNPAVPSMTFVRYESYKSVIGFDERIGFEEDWDLWLRIWKVYGLSAFGNVAWPACYYWINEEERKLKAPLYDGRNQVEGIDVREYFAKTYGITPER